MKPQVILTSLALVLMLTMECGTNIDFRKPSAETSPQVELPEEEIMPPNSMTGQGAVDAAISDQLKKEGVKFETAHAVLWVEKNGLTQAEIEEFGEQVEQGIIDIKKFLGVEYEKKIEYLVSSKVKVSHAPPRGKSSVYLPLDRVRNKSAPYLHETTHVLTRWGPRPPWLSEGLAEYVARSLNWEKKDNVELAKEALASDAGQKVLPLIGSNELDMMPIRQNRKEMARAFYNLSESFVRFLVDNVGIQRMVDIVRAEDTEIAIRTQTGRTTAEWKTTWLNSLGK